MVEAPKNYSAAHRDQSYQDNGLNEADLPSHRKYHLHQDRDSVKM